MFRIGLATEHERDAIYRLRHAVYARELAQHLENPEKRLTDALDAFNAYITVSSQGELVGFVSVTPPSGAGRSLPSGPPDPFAR